MAGRRDRKRSGPIGPRRATRRHRARVWVERGVLGVMMSVVAAVVERRLLKVIRSGSSSKAALKKAERAEEQARSRTAPDRDVSLAAGPDAPDDPGDSEP